MTIDASVYGQIRQPEGPLDQYGKALQLKALMGQGRLQELQTNKLESDIGKENAVDQLFANAAPGASLESLLPDVYRVGGAKHGVEYQGKLLTQRKTQADLAHTEAQTGEITAGHVAGAWAALAKGNGSDQSVQEAHNMMAPLVGEARAAEVSQKLLSMPPETRLAYAVSQAGQHKIGQEALKLFFPPAVMRDTGAEVQPVSTSTLPGGPAPGTPMPGTVPLKKTQSPDSAATDARVAAEGVANRANHRLIAGVDAGGRPLNSLPEGAIDLAKVSPVDMEAAYRYFSDGSLPPNMGRGQQGMAESRRIRAISAQISQSLGVSPEDARANQLAFKGSGQAITQLVRREAQIGANVRNFDFNADQVLQLSQQVDRTGVPVVNAWMNAGRRSVQGNPELSAFDVAVKTTVNEFAQIVSGTTAGATTEGEKQKAEKLLNAAQTPAQITAIVNQMRIESQNRMKSFADQKRATLESMRAGGKAVEAGKTPAASPGAQPGRLVPATGAVQDGYRFKGGDPSKPESWEKV